MTSHSLYLCYICTYSGVCHIQPHFKKGPYDNLDQLDRIFGSDAVLPSRIASWHPYQWGRTTDSGREGFSKNPRLPAQGR